MKDYAPYVPDDPNHSCITGMTPQKSWEIHNKSVYLAQRTHRDHKYKQCPYDMLGVSVGSSWKEIRKAAIKLIAFLHPDTNPELYSFDSLESYNVWRQRSFKEIVNAFNILKKKHNTSH